MMKMFGSVFEGNLDDWRDPELKLNFAERLCSAIFGWIYLH